MKKKLEWSSRNILIIAVIVIVVFIVIFSGGVEQFSKDITNLNTCKDLGGRCYINACGTDSKEYTTWFQEETECGKDLTQYGGRDEAKSPFCCERLG